MEFEISCYFCGKNIIDSVKNKKCFVVRVKDMESKNEEIFYVCRKCGLKKLKFYQI